jgi:hypothetical protein
VTNVNPIKKVSVWNCQEISNNEEVIDPDWQRAAEDLGRERGG